MASDADDHESFHLPDNTAALVAAMQAIHDAQALLRQRIRGRLHIGPSDLSAVQLIIRAELREVPVRARDITRMLGVTSAAASVIVDRLVLAGLVERHMGGPDKRTRMLATTPDGSARITEIMLPMYTEMQALVDGMPAADLAAMTTFALAFADVLERAVPQLAE